MRNRFAVLVIVTVLASGCIAAPEQSPGEPAPPTGSAPTRTAPTGPSGTPDETGFLPVHGANLLIRAARNTAPTATEAEVAALAAANAGFALDVYRSLAADSDANIVLGPHSISSVLAMVYAGARGETASEMAAVLHFDTLDGDVPPTFNALDLALRSRSDGTTVDLQLANQLFVQPGYTLLDSYLATLGRDFGAPLAELDFADAEAARQVINDWAAERTNQRITDLFPPNSISPNVRLVVANAVSLDAQWRYLFDPAHTRDEPFRLPDGSVVDVPTMHFDLYLPLVWTPEYQAVELLYGNGDLSMVVILPDDLARFEQTVDVDRLERIFAAISEQGIHLSLPKFSFKAHTDLDTTLQALGMTTAYSRAADFSGMTGSAELFLSTVQHEAFIEIDEEGTEAHAASGAAMAVSHGPSITFDRPFFFVIRDRATGSILFLGRVTDPRE